MDPYQAHSLFHMKMTITVTKNFHQDCGLCYLHLPILFLQKTLLFYAGKVES